MTLPGMQGKSELFQPVAGVEFGAERMAIAAEAGDCVKYLSICGIIV